MDAFWRAANYLSAGQFYLLANPLPRERLKLKHINHACWVGSTSTRKVSSATGDAPPR